jgi:thiamine-phosphate pyrophosphorylase
MNMRSKLYQHRLRKFIEEVTIYPVSCERLANGRSDIEWLEGVLDGGARIVQLRDKESDDLTFYKKAVLFREKTLAADALFIVNNRVDIALLAGADGVHLGNTDLPAAEVRRICPDLLIGVSCNNESQAASAKGRAASYFNIGPLFSTRTKSGLAIFLGAAAVPLFAARSDLPFSVMGGIKLENVPDLVASGARRIAVVTALTQAEDIAAETRKWRQAIENNLALID